MKQITQLEGIRHDFLSGKSVTPLDALRDHGCFRLSAIVYRLKHEEDMPIDSLTPNEALSLGYISQTTRDYIGDHNNIAVYCIPREKLDAYKQSRATQLKIAL